MDLTDKSVHKTKFPIVDAIIVDMNKKLDEQELISIENLTWKIMILMRIISTK